MTTDLVVREPLWLERIERVTSWLDEAQDIEAVKEIRDKAEAFKKLAEHVEHGEELRQEFARLTILAERRAGQMLLETVKAGRPKKGSTDSTISDIGVSKFQSGQWQKLAKINEGAFDHAVNELAERGRLSTSSVLAFTGQTSKTKAEVFLLRVPHKSEFGQILIAAAAAQGQTVEEWVLGAIHAALEFVNESPPSPTRAVPPPLSDPQAPQDANGERQVTPNFKKAKK